jgi:preprotein translocase subunit SecY
MDCCYSAVLNSIFLLAHLLMVHLALRFFGTCPGLEHHLQLYQTVFDLFADQAALTVSVYLSLLAAFISFPTFVVAIPASSCHVPHFNAVFGHFVVLIVFHVFPKNTVFV